MPGKTRVGEASRRPLDGLTPGRRSLSTGSIKARHSNASYDSRLRPCLPDETSGSIATDSPSVRPCCFHQSVEFASYISYATGPSRGLVRFE
jgi:hypothetical protein